MAIPDRTADRPSASPPATRALPASVEAQLLEAAAAARRHAHAPYSDFAVGAAVLDEQGRIHLGCNVENAAYPLGSCAEAGALSALVVAGGRRAVAVAVVAEASQPVLPCGGCRQKLRELGDDALLILAGDATGLRSRHTLGELLPLAFGPTHLERP